MWARELWRRPRRRSSWSDAASSSPPAAVAPRSYDTVCLFADVSGFTALSEAMSKDGPEGAEYVAKHVCGRLPGPAARLTPPASPPAQLIFLHDGPDHRLRGGRRVQVCGRRHDRWVPRLSATRTRLRRASGSAHAATRSPVLWPKNDDIEIRTRRAAQCALRIQLELHRAELAEGVELSVKVGIGVGPVSVLHMGGMLNRLEYVAVGEPLVQAFNAEGDVRARLSPKFPTPTRPGPHRPPLPFTGVIGYTRRRYPVPRGVEAGGRILRERAGEPVRLRLSGPEGPLPQAEDRVQA